MYQQFGLKSHLWPLVAEPPNIPNIHSTAEYKYRYKYKYKAENPSLTTAKYPYVGNEDDSKGSDKIQFSVDPCCKLISFLVYFCPPGRQNFYSPLNFYLPDKKTLKRGFVIFSLFQALSMKMKFLLPLILRNIGGLFKACIPLQFWVSPPGINVVSIHPPMPKCDKIWCLLYLYWRKKSSTKTLQFMGIFHWKETALFQRH